MEAEKNYSDLIALHNFPKGREKNNCWGDCVTVLKTPSKQPYYLNLHAIKSKDDFGDTVAKGTYIFKVKSTNSKGVWIENERMLEIEVLPAIWETGWAFLLYFLIS